MFSPYLFDCTTFAPACVPNWSAWASIVSAISAAAAAWAAWAAWKGASAAERAAKIALEIDQKAALRRREREDRDAAPISIALQHELENLAGLVDGFPEILRSVGDDPAQLLAAMAQARDHIQAPILERAFLQLGCFDADTARQLGVTLTMVQALRSSLSPGDIDSLDPSKNGGVDIRPQVVEAVRMAFGRLAPRALRPIDIAIRLLASRNGIPALDIEALRRREQAE